MKNEDQDFKAVFGTSRTFTDWLQDPANPLVYCLLTLDGKDFLSKNSYTVELHQKTADHDCFTITVPDDAVDSFEGYVLENSKNLLGKNLSIAYWRFGKLSQIFSGIIGGIRNRKNEGGGYGILHITGHAPSILLESGKNCQSFEEKTLEEIIKEVTINYPQETRVKTDIPNTKHVLAYTVQYKESDYQFIRRLAIRHGEFFYYNGENLIFGTTTQPLVNLEENIDLIDVEFELKMQAQNFRFISYDTISGSKTEKDSSILKSEFKENPFQSIGINRSDEIFSNSPKMHFNHAGISSDSESELEEAVRLEKERRENLMNIRGKSKDPDLKIGGRVRLSDINGKAMETYRIIEIRHIHAGGDDYYNEFIGIPDLFNAAHYIDTEAIPKGEEQPARVVENNDPLGMGRVRVQFPWQQDKGEKTPFIRLIQPHSGAGKGFYFIPEIGEEVLVGFEGGNAEKPFVVGTHYNGAETSSYHTAGNDKKVIHTRSGTKIILNDAEGSIFIEDPSGNMYLMDGKGNINLNAPKNFTLNAGENINLTAGKNMNINIGMNSNETIGMNKTVGVGMMKMLSIGTDFITNVVGKLSHYVKGDLETYADKDYKTIAIKGLKVSSENTIQHHAEKEVQNNSGEKSKNH
ncbi:type VI secretion system Vgr family protein [Flavobacterium sp. B17]|uniref:type VI secretion system Vgr family protein n=1 Tax=Flavobacterium sp. B17 TaxID=95618 RepID=UPI00034C3486|nr:phage baseplate assembly protein V [Flavobacterium sp. B17]